MKHSHDAIENIKDKLMRESSFNKIIIVIDYAKTKPTTRFSNHLNILEQCLNEVLDSSIIVIINRVNAKTPHFDLKRLRDEMRCCFKKRILKDFIFLEETNHNLNENEQNNVVLDQMRKLLDLDGSYMQIFPMDQCYAIEISLQNDQHPHLRMCWCYFLDASKF